jgi:hypothetical protein
MMKHWRAGKQKYANNVFATFTCGRGVKMDISVDELNPNLSL